MRASDWRELLHDSGGLEKFYETGPELNSCDLIYLHLDERDNSLTLNFEADTHSTSPVGGEIPAGCNVVEFYLTFFGVRSLEVDGWQSHTKRRIEVFQQGPEEGIHASITSDGEFVKFTADSASVIHSKAKRKAAE